MNRAEALEQIVTFGKHIDEAYTELLKYGYDSDVEYFVVSIQILEDTLSLYLDGEIDEEELEDWANFIECRERPRL